MKEIELIKVLEKEFPVFTGEEWDFPGYAIKTPNNNLNKILICLDVNKFSIEKAIKEKVNLIISFHPFKFASKWSEIYEYDPTKKEQVEQLKKHKISVYSLHTNFDKHPKGTKFHFIKKLGFENHVNKFLDYAAIIDKKISFNELTKTLKNKLKINNVLSNVNSNKTFKNIYIWPGAGDVYEFLNMKNYKKIDCIITSDIKWNEQQLLNSQNVNFIIIPHKTEDVFVEAMHNLIIKKFPDLKIIDFIQDDFIKGF